MTSVSPLYLAPRRSHWDHRLDFPLTGLLQNFLTPSSVDPLSYVMHIPSVVLARRYVHLVLIDNNVAEQCDCLGFSYTT